MKTTLTAALLCTTALVFPSIAATLPDTPIWSKTVVSAGTDQQTMVCTDNAGNTIVGGHRTAANAAFTAKYNASGVLLWNKNAPAAETPADCVTDAANNIYTVDQTYIKRFTPIGTLVWRSKSVPGSYGGVMNYENIAMGTSGAMWVSGNYVDGCMAAGGPCPPDWTAGGAVMKVATSTGVKLPTISIKTEQNVPISDIATNRYGDLFVINGTHRWEGTWDDGVLPPAWPATCPFPYSFVSKWLANGKPVTRVCMDFNNLLPEKITADFAGDPIILGKAPGHMSSPVSVRKLNHITLAPVWQVGLPSQVGITNVRSISADRWTGQSIIASFGTGYGGPVLPTKNVFSLANTGAVRWQRKWTQLATDAAIIPLTAVASDGNIMTYGSNTASDAVLNKYAR